MMLGLQGCRNTNFENAQKSSNLKQSNARHKLGVGHTEDSVCFLLRAPRDIFLFPRGLLPFLSSVSFLSQFLEQNTNCDEINTGDKKSH